MREFRWGTQRFADPDPGMSPEAVRDLYAAAGFPELTTCAIQVTKEADAEIVTLAKQAPAGVAATPKQTVSFVSSQGSRG